MMSDNESISNVMNSLNSVSKVFVILQSIKDSEFKYLEVLNPKDGGPIMKIKMNLDNDGMVNFLDTFFDEGFNVRRITKDDFDSLDTEDIVKYNIQ